MHCHLRHTFDAGGRILQVFEPRFAQLLGDADRRLHRPGGVGVEAESGARPEAVAHELDGVDLAVRVQHSALQLEDRHAVSLMEALRLAHELFGRQRLPPLVLAGLLVEQVRRERYSPPRGAAEQVVDWPTRGLADEIQTGNLNGREDARAADQHAQRL